MYVRCTDSVGALLRTLSNALIYQRKYYIIRIAFSMRQTRGTIVFLVLFILIYEKKWRIIEVYFRRKG